LRRATGWRRCRRKQEEGHRKREKEGTTRQYADGISKPRSTAFQEWKFPGQSAALLGSRTGESAHSKPRYDTPQDRQAACDHQLPPLSAGSASVRLASSWDPPEGSKLIFPSRVRAIHRIIQKKKKKKAPHMPAERRTGSARARGVPIFAASFPRSAALSIAREAFVRRAKNKKEKK
jgi:hypothetical protein